MERTLVIIKPCALQRGIAGEVLSRFFSYADYFSYDSPLLPYLYAFDEL